MISRIVRVLAPLALVSAPLRVSAQVVPSAEALAAGARVARAVIDPYPVRFSRGDSATVKVTLVDSIGSDVTGASWTLRTEGAPDHPIRVRYRLVETPGQPSAYVMSGDRPGSQVFHVAVRTSVGGRIVTRDIDSVTVTIADWPIAKIVIEDLAYEPYVGTTFRLKARVLTDHDTEAEGVRILWRTDDPCHAHVTSDGVVTFAQPGKINVFARAEGIQAKREINIATNPVATVEMTPKSAQARVGDLVRLRIGAMDRRGIIVPKVAYSFSVAAVDSAGGEIVGDGDFIAEKPGVYVIRASAGDPTAESVVEVGPRPPATPVAVTARAALPRAGTRALWVFTGKDSRDYAYAGAGDGAGPAVVYAWDVTDATNPVLTDSVTVGVGASSITDLKVNGDASWAVVGRLPGTGARGGVTVLDLSRPGHPVVASEYTEGVSEGIRAVWINAPSAIVYGADATSGSLVVLDLTDPLKPRFVSAVEATPGRRAEIYDIWADGKQAYLAAGGDGLIVLDVSDKGTPTAPRVLTTLTWTNASARSVVRTGRYAFVSETMADCETCVNGPRGEVHVIDVQKPREPTEVARYGVPEAGAGRLWAETGVVFAAYHQGGLRIVDTSGELAHDLYAQRRQAGWFVTGGRAGTSPMVVAAVPYKGHIYVVDVNTGLWVLSHRLAGRLGS